MSWVDALSALIEERLSEVHTGQPARVVAYDPATNRATVQPMVPKALADGTPLPAPAVQSVPVVWSQGGGATITMPLAPGDTVWLAHGSRSLDGWASGDNSAPDDPRMHDLSDCVAIPGAAAQREAGSATDLVIRFGGSTIALKPNGDVEITVGGVLKITGAVEITGASVKHNGKEIGSTHTHTAVQPGGGVSGPPA